MGYETLLEQIKAVCAWNSLRYTVLKSEVLDILSKKGPKMLSSDDQILKSGASNC